jgi:hypothetical protein
VYVLRSFDDMGQTLTIPRVLDDDHDGILYIGKAKLFVTVLAILHALLALSISRVNTSLGSVIGVILDTRSVTRMIISECLCGL